MKLINTNTMKKTFSLLIIIAAVVSSCSPFSLESSKVLNNADLSTYKSFSIQPANEATLPEGVFIGDVNNIYKEVANQLIARGYKEVPSNPEMLICLALSVSNKVETKDAIPTTGFGYHYFGPRASYVHSYYDDAKIVTGISKEGNLMMDIVDAKNNIHIFCAEVSAVADGTKIKDLQKIREAVSMMFSRYPVPIVTK